ncbi:MAG: holo-ACP synthase [Raoultibacter sp.]
MNKEKHTKSEDQPIEQKDDQPVSPSVEEEEMRPSPSFDEAIAQGQVGLGVDIVEIARMARIIERTPSFVNKIFSEDERAYCLKKSSPETHFAMRFAAKEAVLKALGTGFSEGIGPRDIEVGRTKKGRPLVILKGRAKEVAESYGVLEMPLSLSYTHQDAVACAMAITQVSVKVAEEKVDPMAELAKQFKEARSLLDEMDKPSPNEQLEEENSDEQL